MKVILGLGNPGRQYEATRHNVGWWLLDHLADVWRFEGWKRDGEALVLTCGHLFRESDGKRPIWIEMVSPRKSACAEAGAT